MPEPVPAKVTTSFLDELMNCLGGCALCPNYCLPNRFAHAPEPRPADMSTSPFGRGRERFEQLCICEHLRSGCRGCLAHQRVGVPKPLLQEETQRLLVMLVHDLSCALATTWAPATSRCVR